MSLAKLLVTTLAALACVTASAQTTGQTNPLESASVHQPTDYGVLVQGGNGITDNRDGFHFLAAGVHAGKVLTNNFGPGLLHGNFEYAMELFPYWQSFTPKFSKVNCSQLPGTAVVSCSQPYTVGGTYTGVSVTPIIMRWNFVRHGRLQPWVQAAGGVLWTNHKYPAYGSTNPDLQVNGPNGDASVWNFTPQGGIGFHYFTRPNRSIDFSANGEHISSASLGDRNPGVNASVQFTVGYSWWK
ncbi:acyloxyacyl hydrolase [Granulicella tundricola]|uniref:Lipid A 3-O-deacylase-related protein n=1 Tax=Granulicella tundricola (strain ATCC BAA-1859 / DSM 23138 / MP5ACTX9) TaxID=1198114 RepID=E8X0K3_GRATM|nr:acyloxyacyl hydrolase [Granulicella tundricola]ADW68954.1 Lipid A 3-O-deacylase-related protein [Granulicella tundricola MP5ACTX9]